MRGNQRIVLTTVAILSLVVAACGPAPTPQAMLETALAALEEEPYHFEMDMQMTMTEAGVTMEVPFTFIGDFQAPDRVQGTVSITFLGMTIESETITVGETAYAINPETGQWEISTELASPFAPEDFTGINPASIEDLAIVGEETLDGTPVYHLVGTASAQAMGDAMAGIEGELQVEYWIGVEDGRLRQGTVEGELSVPGEVGTIGLIATTTYSGYGQEVAIEPPELPTPIPAATFQPPTPTPAPPVVESMRQLEPGWTSYMTEGELTENIQPGAVVVGGFWADIAVASDGALWFITLGGGVLQFDGETWTPYTQEDGLASNTGLSSTAGRGPLGGTGDMQWFATAEGICRFDGETWTSYPESAHLASGPGPTAIGPDSALWYGTAKGATRFDGEDWMTYTTADGLAANYVLDIVVGPEGALWFATNGGVSRFDGDSWTSFTTADGLAHNRVASAALAPDGALWFGTEGGVSRFDGETWTTYTTADGLVHNEVDAVAAAGNVLWFGTRGGVSQFDGKTWISYTSADGLVDDDVNAVEVAPDGAVWFATEGGLSRYMPQQTSGAGEVGSALSPTAYAAATPVEEGNPVALEHFRRGVDYQEQGQLGLAIEEFTHAIEVESEFIEAYLLRGMTYIALGEPDKGIADLDRALPDLDRAVEQDPRLAEAYFNRGLAHFFKFDYDKAIADFDRAIELNPRYVEAYAVRGNAYDNNGEFDKALSSYGEALALDLEKDQHALLLFDRGQAYARHGDKDLAIADLEKALELGLPPVVPEQAEAIL